MPLHRPSAEHVLRQLAQSTAEFARASEVGDLGAAEQALAHRETELEALRCALEAADLNSRQLEQLDQVARQGDAAFRSLVARRETARARISELEEERRRLAGWAPQRPAPSSRLNVKG